MIYPYTCTECGYVEVVKSTADACKPELCGNCGRQLERIYTVPQVSTRDVYTGYNPALGKQIKNKGHLREELARHEAETGIHLHEVGNEKATVKPIEPNWELTPSECRKVGSILQSVEGA